MAGNGILSNANSDNTPFGVEKAGALKEAGRTQTQAYLEPAEGFYRTVSVLFEL